MKLTALLLTASLAVNATLLVLLITTRDPNSGGIGASSIQSHKVTVHPPIQNPETSASRPAEKIWPRLDANDLPALAGQLRRAGFPPAMIRAIIVVLADAQRRARVQQLVHQGAPAEPRSMDHFLEEMAAGLKLEKESDELLNRLLGPQWKLEDDAFRIEIADKFGALSPEKMLRVHEIVTDFEIAAYETYAHLQTKNSEGMILPADSFEGLEPNELFPPEVVAYLKSIEAEKNARLAALLSPAELEEHRLLTHPAVGQFRRDLGEFEPTESEYRALFAIRQQIDRDLDARHETTAAAHTAAEAPLQAQFAAALGAERYAEYRQVTDPASTRLNHLVTRLELPVAAAMQVTALQREATERANLLRADGALHPEQRDAQLIALADEATGKVTAILGARGLEAYRRYGGYWLDLIPPNPLVSPAAPTPAH